MINALILTAVIATISSISSAFPLIEAGNIPQARTLFTIKFPEYCTQHPRLEYPDQEKTCLRLTAPVEGTLRATAELAEGEEGMERCVAFYENKAECNNRKPVLFLDQGSKQIDIIKKSISYYMYCKSSCDNCLVSSTTTTPIPNYFFNFKNRK